MNAGHWRAYEAGMILSISPSVASISPSRLKRLSRSETCSFGATVLVAAPLLWFFPDTDEAPLSLPSIRRPAGCENQQSALVQPEPNLHGRGPPEGAEPSPRARSSAAGLPSGPSCVLVAAAPPLPSPLPPLSPPPMSKSTSPSPSLSAPSPPGSPFCSAALKFGLTRRARAGLGARLPFASKWAYAQLGLEHSSAKRQGICVVSPAGIGGGAESRPFCPTKKTAGETWLKGQSTLVQRTPNLQDCSLVRMGSSLISPRFLAMAEAGEGCEYSHVGFVQEEAYLHSELFDGCVGKDWATGWAASDGGAVGLLGTMGSSRAASEKALGAATAPCGGEAALGTKAGARGSGTPALARRLSPLPISARGPFGGRAAPFEALAPAADRMKSSRGAEGPPPICACPRACPRILIFRGPVGIVGASSVSVAADDTRNACSWGSSSMGDMVSDEDELDARNPCRDAEDKAEANSSRGSLQVGGSDNRADKVSFPRQ